MIYVNIFYFCIFLYIISWKQEGRRYNERAGEEELGGVEGEETLTRIYFIRKESFVSREEKTKKL